MGLPHRFQRLPNILPLKGEIQQANGYQREGNVLKAGSIHNWYDVGAVATGLQREWLVSRFVLELREAQMYDASGTYWRGASTVAARAWACCSPSSFAAIPPVTKLRNEIPSTASTVRPMIVVMLLNAAFVTVA